MTRRWSLLAILLILVGLAGMAYQHFDFGEPLESYEQRWDLNASQLDSLNISSDSTTDVDFVPSANGSSYIEVSGTFEPNVIDKLKHTAAAADGLSLDLTDRQFEFFSIQFHSPKHHITVAIPESARIGHFQLNLGSSNSVVNGLQAGIADLKAVSGSVTVTNGTADQLNLKASSGSISAEQVKAVLTANLSSGSLTLKDVNGPVTFSVLSGRVRGERINGQIQGKASSGNITLDDLTGNGQLEVSSGNITLNGQRSDHLDITARSGNVRLSIDEAFQGFYDLQTGSGSVHAPEGPQKTNDVIKIRTGSGNIAIK